MRFLGSSSHRSSSSAAAPPSSASSVSPMGGMISKHCEKLLDATAPKSITKKVVQCFLWHNICLKKLYVILEWMWSKIQYIKTYFCIWIILGYFAFLFAFCEHISYCLQGLLNRGINICGCTYFWSLGHTGKQQSIKYTALWDRLITYLVLFCIMPILQMLSGCYTLPLKMMGLVRLFLCFIHLIKQTEIFL